MAKYNKESPGSKEYRRIAFENSVTRSRTEMAQQIAGNKLTYLGSSLSNSAFYHPERHLLGTPYNAQAPAVSSEVVVDKNRSNFVNSLIRGRSNINHGIWGRVTSPSPYTPSPQYIVEQIMGIKNNDVLLSLDLETLGSAGGEFFSPTQIGVTPFMIDKNIADQITGGQLPATAENLSRIMVEQQGGVSVLTKPDQNTIDKLQRLITRLKDDKGLVVPLTPDERRSLKDLGQYAGDAQFSGKGIMLKSNSLELLEGTNLKDYWRTLQQGLNNLVKYGAEGTEAFQILESRMQQAGLGSADMKLLGTNVLSADIPWVKAAYGKDAFDKIPFLGRFKGNYIDVYGSLKMANADIWSALYEGRTTSKVMGTGRLENIYMQAVGEAMQDAHFSLADTKATGKVFGFLYPMLKQSIEGGNVAASGLGGFQALSAGILYNPTPLKEGDVLFAMRSLRAGSELDAVKRGKDISASGGYVGFKNRTYQIKNQFKQDYNGQTYYGITLNNLEDQIDHVIARNSPEALQASIQQAFVPMDMARDSAQFLNVRGYALYDAARWEYESLFKDEGSFKKIRKYRDFVAKIRRSGATDIDGAIDRTSGLTSVQKSKLKLFYNRFDKEFEVIDGLVNHPGIGNLKPFEKDIAIRTLRSNLDTRLSPGTIGLALPTEVVRQIQMFDPYSGGNKAVSIASFSDLTRGINSLLTSGGKEEINLGNIKDRFSRIGTDLAQRGLIDRGQWMNTLGKDSSIMKLLGRDLTTPTRGSFQLAERLATLITNHGAYQGAMDRSITVPDLGANAYGGQSVAALLGNDMNTVINDAINISRSSFRGAGDSVISNPNLAAAINEQAGRRLRQILGSNPNAPATISEEIEALANRMAGSGIVTNVLPVTENGVHKGVTLQMMSAAEAARVVKSGNIDPNKIVQVSIPVADGENILSTGGISKINRLSAIRRGGRAMLSSTQNKPYFLLGEMAQELAELMSQNRYGEANRRAGRAVYNSLNTLSSASRYVQREMEDSLSASSRMSNWIRSGHIDVSQVADSIIRSGNYTHMIGGKSVALTGLADLNLNERHDLIRDIVYGGETYNGSSIKFNTAYGQAVRNTLKRDLGLNYNVAGVKSELVGEFILGLNDPRQLSPLGMFTGAGKENLRQAQNNYLLNETNARLINPIMATDVALAEQAGEVTGLTLRNARMTDQLMKEIIVANNSQEFWDNMSIFDRPTVNEQVIMMRKSAAQKFGVTQEVRKVITQDMGLELDVFVGQEISPKTTLGKVMRESATRPDGTEYMRKIVPGAKDLIYDGMENAVVRDIRQIEGGTEVILDKMMGVGTGTKFMNYTGRKGTAHVVDDAMWERMFGQYGTGVDVIYGGEPGKSALEMADVLQSRMNLALDTFMDRSVTVGKMARVTAEEEALRMINGALFKGKGKAKFVDTVKNGQVVRVLQTPGNISEAMTVSMQSLNGIIDHMMGGQAMRGPSGQIIDYGMNSYGRSMIEEYSNVWGKVLGPDDGIRYGMRELQVIRSHMNYYSGQGIDLNPLYKYLEGNVITNLKTDKGGFIPQMQGMLKSLEYGSTGRIGGAEGTGDYTVFRSAGTYLAGSPNQALLRDLEDLPHLAKGYTSSQVAGTILDPKMAGGKGFFFQMPTNVMVNGKPTDNIFVPSMKNQYIGGVMQPNRTQSLLAGIYRNSVDYTMAMQDGEKGAANAPNILRRLTGNVNALYDELGNELFGSQGYVANNIMGARLPHSGRFKATGMSIADYSTANEGAVYISEARARQFTQGLGKTEAERIMGQFNNEGVAMVLNRYPTISSGSLIPSMVKIARDGGVARAGMDDAMFVTVGLAARLAGDFDGDYMSLMMPHEGGKKAQAILEKTTRDWFAADNRVTQAAGEWAYQKMAAAGAKSIDPAAVAKMAQEDPKSLYNHISTRVGIDDAILEVESRLQKTVGPFSNLARKYRMLAETTDAYAGQLGGGLYDVLGAYATAVEQKPISAKHLETRLGKADMLDYVTSNAKLRSALQSFNVDDIIEYSKQTGIFKMDETVGKMTLDGITNTEYAARYGKPIYLEDVQTALGLLRSKSMDRNNPIFSTSLNIFSSQPGSSEEALQMVNDLLYNPQGIMPLSDVKEFYKKAGYNDLVPAVEQAYTRDMSASVASSTIGGTVNRIATHGGGATGEGSMGARFTQVASEFGSKFLGGIKGTPGMAIGGVLAGAWAIASAISAPTVEREPVQTRDARAPSADGTYVDPTIFAGAPEGAGPSAYVSQRGRGYEKMRVNIKARSFNGITNDEASELITNEIRRQAQMDLKVDITSQDDRQTIDKQWLQEQFMSALKTGYVD